MDESSTAYFRELKENVDGRSVDEIESYVRSREGGADALLDLVFGELPKAFLPERADSRDIDFQYEITTTAGPRSYFASVQDGRCTCGPGRLGDPRVTMTMDLPVFLQVLTGSLTPVRAFLTRKIRVSGDMMAATKFESWFARP